MAKPKDPLQPDEYGRAAMDRLRAALEEQHKQTSHLSWVMLCLTIVTGIAAGIQAFAAGHQLYWW
jgi:hypothetical protein